MPARNLIQRIISFFQLKEEIDISDKFLSPRLVREALERRFQLIPMEETNSHLRLKIIRFLRIYGGPMIWPHAQIDLTIKREGPTTILYWHFYWPDYYALCFWPIIFALTLTKQIQPPILMLPVAILFHGLFIFLDTLWVARNARKAIQRT
jgi:hypothetical protein